jgi:hypothetical protein
MMTMMKMTLMLEKTKRRSLFIEPFVCVIFFMF